MDSKMDDSEIADFLAEWRVQDYLSFGYLYLLVLGVVSDSIYYGALGINVISYSTILDVLLSPVVKLTDELLFPVTITLMPALIWFTLEPLKRMEEKEFAKRRAKRPDKTHRTPMILAVPDLTAWFVLTCMIIFSTFIGYGSAAAWDGYNDLRDGDFEPNTQLIFQDGSKALVKVWGHNSEYIFYARAGDSTVSASPIKDSLLAIRELADIEKPAPAAKD